MKKLIAMLLAAAMLLSLCACGSSSSDTRDIEDISDEEWEAAAEKLAGMDDAEPAVEAETEESISETEAEETTAETEAEETIYQLGDVITSADGMVEVTIDSFAFGDYMGYSDVNSSYILLDGPVGYHFEAPAEKTYLLITGTLTLVGEIQRNSFWGLNGSCADYKDGYTFWGTLRAVIPDKQNGYDGSGGHFEPLVGNKSRLLSIYIEVPEVVETDTESPLLFKSSIGGEGTSLGFTVQLR